MKYRIDVWHHAFKDVNDEEPRHVAQLYYESDDDYYPFLSWAYKSTNSIETPWYQTPDEDIIPKVDKARSTSYGDIMKVFAYYPPPKDDPILGENGILALPGGNGEWEHIKTYKVAAVGFDEVKE